jgi:hypothetical protein
MDDNRLEAIIIGKLGAEGLSIQSPWGEIEACLAKTVSPSLLISVARKMKERDQLGIGI